jgi:predicted RNA polymerase sigma factor
VDDAVAAYEAAAALTDDEAVRAYLTGRAARLR